MGARRTSPRRATSTPWASSCVGCFPDRGSREKHRVPPFDFHVKEPHIVHALVYEILDHTISPALLAASLRMGTASRTVWTSRRKG